jgi:hypothetical protein
MQEEIPITFAYEGKDYSGHFSAVSGGGSSSTFHLMIDSFFQGQLVNSENYGWQFYNNKEKFKKMADYFGEYITAYLQ